MGERRPDLRERVACEFQLIRYVPDPVKGEFANIGVLLREAGSGQTAVRLTRSWTRVRCLDADADLAMLEALEAELGERTGPGVAERSLLEVAHSSFSNAIQITDARGCLAESVPAELDRLMELYVSPRKVTRARQGGRTAMLRTMRREFERAGVWTLLRRNIPASEYTGAGDTLRIDCGYRPNGVVRLFQAVALPEDTDGAKVLAFSAARLREGVRRVEGAELELTAVVEPLRATGRTDEEQDRYGFAVAAMEREAIRVLTAKDLPRVTETARQELGV